MWCQPARATTRRSGYGIFPQTARSLRSLKELLFLLLLCLVRMVNMLLPEDVTGVVNFAREAQHTCWMFPLAAKSPVLPIRAGYFRLPSARIANILCRAVVVRAAMVRTARLLVVSSYGKPP